MDVCSNQNDTPFWLFLEETIRWCCGCKKSKTKEKVVGGISVKSRRGSNGRALDS
jgi:hypothetical protein